MRIDLLTPAEAAVVAGVTMREINRVIDEKILPAGFCSSGVGRQVRLVACPLIGFYFRAAKVLTAEHRLRLIDRFADRIAGDTSNLSLVGWRDADWTVQDGFLTVSLTEFVADSDDRSKRLAAAQEMVVEDPAILGGAAVLRGTRIPVHDLAASVTAGIPRARIVAGYPGLDETTLDLAVIYAEANPVRGRPRHSAVRRENAIPISQRKVPRHYRA